MTTLTLDEDLRIVLDEYAQAKKNCEDWHQNITRWRAWYSQDHYTKIKGRGKAKPNEQRYNDPTPTNTVDLAVGIILSHPLEFRASGWSPAGGEEEASSQIEKYLLGTIEINQQREELHIPYQALFYFVRDGAAVLYSPWDPQLADQYMTTTLITDAEQGAIPIKAYMESPIRVQVIDPTKTYWLAGGPRRWEAVFREEELSLYDVEALYLGGARLDGFTHLSTVEQRKKHRGKLIDVWRFRYKNVAKTNQKGQLITNKVLGKVEMEPKWVVQRGLIFEKRWVWPIEDTPYQDLPYTIGFFKPTNPVKSDGWGDSILRPSEETLIFVENAINARQRQIRIFSALPMMGKFMSGRNLHVDRSLFNFVEMDPSEDIGFPRWPGNPPDVDRQIEHFKGRLQQAGFSEIAYGRGQEETGYALSQMMDQNRIRLDMPVRHLELLWESWARKVLRLTETFGGDCIVRVYGSMRGKEFEEQVKGMGLSHYLVKTILKPEFPGEKTRKHAMATQAAPFLDQCTIIEEYLDQPQPDDILEKQMLDVARKHPMMVQYGVMSALMELAEDGDQAAQQTLMMMQMQQQGEQGRPQEPREQEQLLGVASPTGELTPQEQGQPAPGRNVVDAMKRLIGASPKMRE